MNPGKQECPHQDGNATCVTLTISQGGIKKPLLYFQWHWACFLFCFALKVTLTGANCCLTILPSLIITRGRKCVFKSPDRSVLSLLQRYKSALCVFEGIKSPSLFIFLAKLLKISTISVSYMVQAEWGQYGFRIKCTPVYLHASTQFPPQVCLAQNQTKLEEL